MESIPRSQRALLTPEEKLTNAITVYLKGNYFNDRKSVYIEEGSVLEKSKYNNINTFINSPILNEEYSLNALTYILAYYVLDDKDKMERINKVKKFRKNLNESDKKFRMTDVIRYIRFFDKVVGSKKIVDIVEEDREEVEEDREEEVEEDSDDDWWERDDEELLDPDL